MNPIDTPPLLVKRIKRIAPLQLGKVFAILYGLLSLVFVPFLLLGVLASRASGRPAAGFLALGPVLIILLPIFYAVLAFVMGVVSAALYNLVARWIGGIEVEVE